MQLINQSIPEKPVTRDPAERIAPGRIPDPDGGPHPDIIQPLPVVPEKAPLTDEVSRLPGKSGPGH